MNTFVSYAQMLKRDWRKNNMPYRTKTVGRYNVNYLGLKKDSIGNLYELVEIIKFNKDDKPVKNTHLYFRSNNLWEHEFVQPDLDTEEELAKYINYRENAKVAIKQEVKEVVS